MTTHYYNANKAKTKPTYFVLNVNNTLHTNSVLVYRYVLELWTISFKFRFNRTQPYRFLSLNFSIISTCTCWKIHWFQKCNFFRSSTKNEKSAHRRCKHCMLAVVRWSQRFSPAANPLPGARDGQNLTSWRWSLPLPTNPVWWGSMHAILSYRGNRPTHTQTTNTHPATHKQTNKQDRLQYTVLQLTSEQCNNEVITEKPFQNSGVTRRLAVLN